MPLQGMYKAFLVDFRTALEGLLKGLVRGLQGFSETLKHFG